MIVITGATGQLGRLVIASLLKKVPADRIVAAVRNPEKAKDLAARGVQVRQADYTEPESWEKVLAGAKKLLLISSNEIGQREAQHKTVIDAAQKAGIELLVYTSLLRADSTPLALGGEHLATEQYLKNSGVPFAVLRNGWYTENYLASVPAALQHGAFIGSVGEGRISSAARADYAEAAAVVLTAADQAGKIYELAGDESYSLAEFAAELSRQTGRQIPYVNLPEAEYKGALLGAGLPEAFAELLANSDAGAARGGLYSEDRSLSTLIGRETTTLATMLKYTLH
ncbi:NAD(P)-dependent oxidoreductase [Geomonas silvestris]|uniref:NAD(P)-dependent oxidoreductase n=1 Tax=Geomonas silvestris TaxID=2740184 RepID=A0A6V8MDV7_9BACT|nr:SDR family oxidoreductase [Geomonas silvestris]GFO58171.1 NAD(P)-dependent oxidoreductase [Geomonas silvestris]